MLNFSSGYAKNNSLEPLAIKCPPGKLYIEDDYFTNKSVDFVYYVDKNATDTKVTKTISLTNELRLSAGLESDIRYIVGGASVNFDLSYQGSVSKTVSITWYNLKPYTKYKLIAGKIHATTYGRISLMDENCNTKTRNVRLSGTYSEYHSSQIMR